jgi:hypothetical protein
VTSPDWKRVLPALGVAQIISCGTLLYAIAVLGPAMRDARCARDHRHRTVRQLHRGIVPVASHALATFIGSALPYG